MNLQKKVVCLLTNYKMNLKNKIFILFIHNYFEVNVFKIPIPPDHHLISEILTSPDIRNILVKLLSYIQSK